MRIEISVVTALTCAMAAVQAQVPHVLGNWKLNVAESELPGPPPQTHVRRYSLAPDGTLVGLAVIVDAQGTPRFLQFAAKPDGNDYAEFDSASLARLQVQGSEPSRTYSETPIDDRTVAWTDKLDGRVIASGRKWVSEDGRQLMFTAVFEDEDGEEVESLYVFDKQ